MNIKEVMKDQRKKLGISQQDLAEMVDKSRCFYKKVPMFFQKSRDFFTGASRGIFKYLGLIRQMGTSEVDFCPTIFYIS